MTLSADQRMAVNAGRMLTRFKTCFVGIGAPSLAAALAQRLLSPSIALIYESGAIGARPDRMPLSTGSPCVADGASVIGSMLDVFGELQAGRIEVGLLAGAQVDCHGNLNSTVIGDYAHPRLRLPGSGGALDIALLANEILILMPHEPRRFVSRVDFITSPGHGGVDRAALKLGRGPTAIVTEKARFDFVSGTAVLAAVFEDVTPDEALDGFPPEFGRADHIETIPLPTREETDILKAIPPA
ncbi:MAG: hypothetical protein KJZ73_03205 [Pseudorhodoplanes sp.]|nr:3-oxoadipate CoA-transferase subunit B [Pseudorhodoplanes sp.]MBW7950077.1 CoA-transferase subunit beta [Pseudorhodoplanes sp.]MCL4710229.1 hypothetical protein [Pseudorhodoplanes sp.]MCQ3941673.1 CoA-transferase subunit beta [Alphaproteobacteria bacterium]GIK79448.1 MAG: 3-oxoadipate--succinyl-CoA transferase subunit B [Alphaproteobacteria bacterium]